MEYQTAKKSKTIENAEITNTLLGYADRPALIFSIELKGVNWTGHYGERVLDNYDQNKNKRIPDQYAMDIIPEILKVVGVKTWEELKGKYVRVECDPSNRTINKIGHLIDDIWLDLDEFFNT